MNALTELVAAVVLFLVLIFGLGLPLTTRFSLRPAEKICLAPAAALIVTYFAAFGIYAFDLPAWSFLILPAAAILGLLCRHQAIHDLLGDEEARRLVRAFIIWIGWVLGLLALVRCYFGVGAGATGDWVEHYQRALFFLGHWPLNYKFIWLYALPARPPLANLVTGAFMALSYRDFAAFQVFTALESALVFLPGWLLYQRFSAGRHGGRAFLLLCMANPLLMHNATYPWTKLITAYFVLVGLHLFLEGMERRRDGEAVSDRDAANSGGFQPVSLDAAGKMPTPHFARESHAVSKNSRAPMNDRAGGYFVACFLLLSAGLLAHYSAGPYGLVLGVCYLLIHRRAWFRRSFLVTTGVVALVSGLLLATWFGWAWRHYGWHATIASNTSVTATETGSWRTQVEDKLGNFVSSFLPLPLRDPGYVPERMSSPAATFDQYGYMFYQLTLPFAFGITGGVFIAWLLARRLLRRGPTENNSVRRFWKGFVFFTVLVGIAVNGGYDKYGLAHICLQPLVVVGLAFLAAELPRVSRRLHVVFWSGLTLDFLVGVGLHFFVEHAGASLLHPGAPALSPAFLSHGPLPPYWAVIWLSNLLAKYYFGLAFLGDHIAPVWMLLVFLAGMLLLALRQPSAMINPPSTAGAPAG